MKLSTLLRTMLLLAGMSIAMLSSASVINPAFEFDAPSFSANFGTDYNFGIGFLANQDLEVDALAYYDDGPSSASHNVALFRMDGTKLAETIVNVSDTLIGNFRYSSIAAIKLQAGESYWVFGNSTGDNYTWNVDNFVVNPMLTSIRYSYAVANSLAAEFSIDAGTDSDMNNAYWGPGLSIHAASVAVPEPASYLLLLAGLAVLLVATQGKKQ
jgi:hypothetical protein